MNTLDKIIGCYDRTAEAYAAQYLQELKQKHLDGILLDAFAAAHRSGGRVLDLGCGPGQTTAWLSHAGVTQLTGIDISEGMIRQATLANPHIPFTTGDMGALPYADQSIAAIVAFYAIVHYRPDELLPVFREIFRVLRPGGEWLFSFHTGNKTVHLDDLLGQSVDIDFYFFDVATLLEQIREAGFEVVDCLERHPYATEFPSYRAYCWVRKPTGVLHKE